MTKSVLTEADWKDFAELSASEHLEIVGGQEFFDETGEVVLMHPNSRVYAVFGLIIGSLAADAQVQGSPVSLEEVQRMVSMLIEIGHRGTLALQQMVPETETKH